MKDLGSMLIRRKEFSEIVMGNTALARGMVEAGTRVITSYPGSPTPEIASALLAIPSENRPFYFEFSVNEKVATEIAFGASINGHLSTVFFKSVGLNVAADTLVQLSMLNLRGGMVIVLGDDPGINSSQNEQDNRHYARMAYTPIFEPGDPQESYEMYLSAAALSVQYAMPVIVRLTTHVCHAKTKVRFGTIPDRISTDEALFDPAHNDYIPLTKKALELKGRALKNLRLVASYAEESAFTREIDNGNKERGIVTCGLPYRSLLEVLAPVSAKPDILCLGMPYPLPEAKLLAFCKEHREVLVVEELDPLIEGDLKQLAFDARLKTRIRGKERDSDCVGEYRPEKVRSLLARTWPDLVAKPDLPESAGDLPDLPGRPAQLCPGCGHRSAFYAVKKALETEDITVADIGCHTLGYLPPYEMGQVLLCMGHSTGTGSGLALFNSERRVCAFLGDSTFFHAGMPGIANAVYNGHNVTLVIMENNTTAMTGHQEHPGTGKNATGQAPKMRVKNVLEGMGVQFIREVEAYQQRKVTEAVEEALNFKGFSVVIARHPCMLKFTREQRRKGVERTARVEVNQEACRRLYDCVSSFACPAFHISEDGGVVVNTEVCIGDGSCRQVCSASALELKTEERDE